MNNPYSVLGVKENASQEEIRAAYLELVKKYHPDKYSDSDLKELANEKLVEINEAYEILTKKSDPGRTADNRRSYDYAGYSGTGSAYSGPNASEFARARAFINQNNLQAAKQVLDAISIRNAEWYYLYGIIYLRQGWYDKAREYITHAYQQEPGNAEYSSAYNSMRNTGAAYSRGGTANGGYTGGCSGCDVCSSLMCADCCCECMGGDMIRCC
ncbi:MAG: DnaJ domain-containing protein [Clostridia bacterium]